MPVTLPVLFLVVLTQGQPPAPADAAAERKLLDGALEHIRDRKYLFAVAKLAPLARSRSLPAPVMKALPDLIANLRSLDAVARLAAAEPGKPFPEVSGKLLPAPVQRPYAWLELLGAVSVMLETPLPPGTRLPWSVEQASRLLEEIAADFDAGSARKLRYELSAKLFLIGRPRDATALIENETPNEYAREVLADLRTIILGGGTLVNPQVARFIPENGLTEMPGVLALVPVSLRDSWQRPAPPVETQTTLAKLEVRSRHEAVVTAKRELPKLTKQVADTVGAIRKEVGKP